MSGSQKSPSMDSFFLGNMISSSETKKESVPASAKEPALSGEKPKKHALRPRRDIKKAEPAPSPVKPETVDPLTCISFGDEETKEEVLLSVVKEKSQPAKIEAAAEKAPPAPSEKEASAPESYRQKKKKKEAKRAPEKTPLSAAPEKPVKKMPPIPAPEKAPDTEFSRSLDGEYGVWQDPEKNKKRAFSLQDKIRYAFLFVSIFGFLFAGFLVGRKLYSYYEASALYQDLRDMVNQTDRFAESYLPRNPSSVESLKISDLLSGKTVSSNGGSTAMNSAQQNLVSKLNNLRAINSDLAGWITISGTVVDYPVMWTQTKSYYLHRDFYGNYLSSGTLYIDNRNSRDLSQNRNTVIFGHNMTNGSMFASLYDFSSPTLFYGARIEIATTDGIYIYTPFSVHESNAMDNYFETDFVSDADFLDFCEELQFISLQPMEHEFTRDTQILTLSTCTNNHGADQRFVVHAYLSQVIR